MSKQNQTSGVAGEPTADELDAAIGGVQDQVGVVEDVKAPNLGAPTPGEDLETVVRRAERLRGGGGTSDALVSCDDARRAGNVETGQFWTRAACEGRIKIRKVRGQDARRVEVMPARG